MTRHAKKPASPKVVALQNDLRRRRDERELSKRYLIVCEDDKSAPNYFKALKKAENLSATSIEIIGSGGNTQPIQVVQAAIRRRDAAADKTSGTEPFDEVWCTIDGDYGSSISNARGSAIANDINLAVSTMCFEYWLLLHFTEHDKSADKCSEVVACLKKYVPGYTKGDCDFSAIVRDVRTASGRAKKLRRSDVLPEEQNPCSDVYLLIDAILELPSTNRRD